MQRSTSRISQSMMLENTINSQRQSYEKRSGDVSRIGGNNNINATFNESITGGKKK